MEEKGHSIAEALAQAHALLMQDIADLESLARAPAGKTIIDLGASLAKVQKHLEDHFRFEEQGGFMDVVLKRDPHQKRSIHLLLADHRQLSQDLQELLHQAGISTALTAGLCEKVLAWIHHLRAHEGRETRLVQEVFNVDFSAED